MIIETFLTEIYVKIVGRKTHQKDKYKISLHFLRLLEISKYLILLIKRDENGVSYHFDHRSTLKC